MTWWARVPRGVWVALALYACLRVPIELMVASSVGTVPLGPGAYGMPPLEAPAVLHPFLRWDSGWYVRIIRDGYSYADCTAPGVPCPQASIAFLPGYPMSVRGAMAFGLSLPLASFLVTHLALLLALWGMLELGKVKLGDDEHGLRAAAAMVVYPASLFLSVGYAEVLFLAMAAWAMVFYEKGQFVGTALLLALGALTRSQGMLLVAAVGGAALLARQWKAVALIGVASGTAVGSYVAWQQQRFGDPLAFLHARRGWGFLGQPALDVLKEYWQRTVSGSLALEGWLDFACIPFLAVVAVLAWRQLGPAYGAFCALVLAAPLTSGQAWAFSRITVCAFPIFLVAARWTANRWVALALSALGLGWLGMSAVRFSNGLFIGT
jgi:hypothetical protein